jgi:site-specific recombinase XerD
MREHTARANWDFEEFILDRQARALSPRTIALYRQNLAIWFDFLQAQGLTDTEQVTPSLIRSFVIWLSEERNHSQGGVAHVFGHVRTFLRWYAAEYAPAGWDPLRNVQAPRRPNDRLPPLPLSDFQALIDETDPHSFAGARDRALLLLLLDTGIRKSEAHALKVGDVGLADGHVFIRKGKGGKSRSVFVGVKTRRALIVYFRQRENEGYRVGDADPLWVTVWGTPLSKGGMREAVKRLAERAGVPEPGWHAFRRAFAVNSLRNGMDVITLQRLLGHADLSVINRYLALVDDDMRQAHERFGVVDKMR